MQSKMLLKSHSIQWAFPRNLFIKKILMLINEFYEQRAQLRP
ncbi:hypothetical protein PBCV1_A464aR [Paramecium bursaria Chlorella virus 1]|uniref:Uncharacterized protein n=1 Tax=Paramecium bursaria Chlorella virus 1 TaxID=10506 RepID=F8TU43_PBCV1|nr:hypothetical protein PBCV1_A464aR [Paramecium bursaria Chlorella virus 1]AEI70104.1 hypothetical protein [Paramecium bursaria Chlorella virus 1]